MMSRPSHLLLITIVSAWGCTVAIARGSTFTLKESFVGFIALILVSISIHYANEYADYETDRLTVRTPYSGGSGTLVISGIPRKLALIGAWITLVTGTGMAISGFATQLISSQSILILILGAFFGWMYSLRPLALAWSGLGELTNAALGGILLPSYAYTIHFRTIDWVALLSFLPFGMLVFVNLLATTWPDRKADAAVGKFTLATRWPAHRLRKLYTSIAIGAIFLSGLLVNSVLPQIVVIGGLFSIPVLVWSVNRYTRIFSPFPSVALMVFFLLMQFAAWLIIAFPDLLYAIIV